MKFKQVPLSYFSSSVTLNCIAIKRVKCRFAVHTPHFQQRFSPHNGTRYWKFIGQCDVKHIMTLPIKTITSILKVSTNIITSIAARSNGLAAIQAIMSVTTFKAAVILYIWREIATIWSRPLRPLKLNCKFRLKQLKVYTVKSV